MRICRQLEFSMHSFLSLFTWAWIHSIRVLSTHHYYMWLWLWHCLFKMGGTKLPVSNIHRFKLLFEYTIYMDGYLYHVVNRLLEILQEVLDSIIKTIWQSQLLWITCRKRPLQEQWVSQFFRNQIKHSWVAVLLLFNYNYSHLNI